MRIAGRSSCEVAQAGARAPKDWPPTLRLLRVAGSAGTMELTGWETARAFEFERHLFGKDICRLEFRQATYP